MLAAGSRDEVMITTVTTVSTVTAIATLGFTTILGTVLAITLMFFLATREVAGSENRSGMALRIAKFASVGILPLVMAFATVFIVEIIKVL